MLASFVVRLTSAALAAGVLAGEVEHVPTGERGEFRDAEELHAWCARLVPAVVPEPRSDLHVVHAPPADQGDHP